MDNLLEKNLACIVNYNEKLVKKICALTGFSKQIELCQTDSGEFNLLVNNTPVHSLKGAQVEAKNIFLSLSHNLKSSIHVIYGFGMGYLPDVFSEKSNGSVIIYEPDIEVLRYVFELVDVTDALNRNNVFLVSDFDEFKSVFEICFRYQSQVSFSFLDYHKQACSNRIADFKLKLEQLFGVYSFNFSFQVKEASNFMFQTIRALDKKYDSVFLTDCKDKFKNVPALIVSAGPSLAKNVETIKKYQDRAMIFCVGTALKTLYNNGIVPDFLNVIEKYNTGVHLDLPCLKDLNLICEPFTNGDVVSRDYKKRYITASLELDSNRWFLEKADKPLVPFETKGTVSYQALFSALYLGCNPIILVGQDLAYTDGKCYAQGSAFDGLECVKNEETGEYQIQPKDFEAFKETYFKNNKFTDEQRSLALKNKLLKLNKSLTFVPSQDGGMLPTESGYALFLGYIEEFAQKYGDKAELINSSIGGAMIKGFKTLPLEKAFTDLNETNIDKSALINSLQSIENIDKSVVVKNIEADCAEIKRVLPLFEQGQKIVKRQKYSIMKLGALNDETINLLSKAADVYVNITNNYTNKNRLLKTMIFKENTELAYHMKTTDGNMDESISKEFHRLFDSYFNAGFDKLKRMLDELNTLTKELV